MELQDGYCCWQVPSHSMRRGSLSIAEHLGQVRDPGNPCDQLIK